ncbi:MAG: ATP-binding protein [Bdellovibrionaceae bacterium]|nr:ATP-binding protein [Pseudobdellovibrionaceae bacterium]
MNVKRPHWEKLLLESWKKRSIVWLAGVRRAGKTTLGKSLEGFSYFNCDDSEIQENFINPKAFLRSIESKGIVLDEIHQIENASQLLKIAADEFPKLKVLATGSSTLAANRKFKDSLTGRKRNLHFLPVLVSELESFGVSLEKRMLYGGLPPALLSAKLDREFYSEWLDSFYARDVQEVFAIDKRQAFLKVFEFILIQNGQLIEATEIAKVSGLSRPTVVKYLEVLELTKALTILKPFSGNPLKEIVAQPKVYGFDTGFVCFAKRDNQLGSTEKGHLLENLVLESMQAQPKSFQIHFWRDKRGHEIDFVIQTGKRELLVIECKSQRRNFSLKNLLIFRSHYPEGKNIVVTLDEKESIEKISGHSIHFMGIQQFFTYFQEI